MRISLYTHMSYGLMRLRSDLGWKARETRGAKAFRKLYVYIYIYIYMYVYSHIISIYIYI